MRSSPVDFRSPRTIWGYVNSDGTIRTGSGDFTVTHTGTGTYAISFRGVPANAQLAATVSAGQTSGTTYANIATDPTPSGMTVRCIQPSGANQDSSFGFVVTVSRLAVV